MSEQYERVIISSTLPLLIWAYEGVVLEDVSTNLDQAITQMRFSYPTSSDLETNTPGQKLQDKLLRHLFIQLAHDIFPPQVQISIESRDEHWTVDKGKEEVRLMMKIISTTGLMETF